MPYFGSEYKNQTCNITLTNIHHSRHMNCHNNSIITQLHQDKVISPAKSRDNGSSWAVLTTVPAGLTTISLFVVSFVCLGHCHINLFKYFNFSPINLVLE